MLATGQGWGCLVVTILPYSVELRQKQITQCDHPDQPIICTPHPSPAPCTLAGGRCMYGLT